MKKIIYNKLVRDKIPEIIKSNGKEAVTHIAKTEETKEMLFKKLIEELNEFQETPNEEELADMLEVIEGIASLFNFSLSSVYKVKQEKKLIRGGFNKRIILEAVIEND